jgi:hypothetical protein
MGESAGDTSKPLLAIIIEQLASAGLPSAEESGLAEELEKSKAEAEKAAKEVQENAALRNNFIMGEKEGEKEARFRQQFERPQVEVEDGEKERLGLKKEGGESVSKKSKERLTVDEQSENDFEDYDAEFPEVYEDQEEVKVSQDNYEEVEGVRPGLTVGGRRLRGRGEPADLFG